MITKTYSISLFRARCRETSKELDLKVGEDYILVSEDLKYFSVYKTNMTTLVGNLDLRAFLAYFAVYSEDVDAFASVVSYDDFTVEKTSDGLTYFEEF